MATGFAPGRASEIGSVYGNEEGGFGPASRTPEPQDDCRQSRAELEHELYRP